MSDYDLTKYEITELARLCERWGKRGPDLDDSIAETCLQNIDNSFYCDLCNSWWYNDDNEFNAWHDFIDHVKRDLRAHVEWAWINEKL